MIQTFSSTIRRKEMDAVLTCMVDEKIGPGELNARFMQNVKEYFGCSGAVALRSPMIALKYVLKALDLQSGSKIMVSALAPSWQLYAISELGFEPLILDVDSETALVSIENIENGMKDGGRLLILHEALGSLPDMDAIIALGIPFIEDISQSALSFIEDKNSPEPTKEGEEKKGKRAGTFGLYAILGLEEHDVITSGGGAVVIASGRREWSALKTYTDLTHDVEKLPDINCALGYIQLKESKRNETTRKEIFALYQRSVLAGKNKTLLREVGDASTAWSFPLVINSSYKDVSQYAAKKDIEIRLAFENSITAVKIEEEGFAFKNAKSLYLRCVLFPLYPRLMRSQVEKISKVLVTLP